MSVDARSFSYPTRLAWMLMALSILLAVGLVLSPGSMKLPGWLIMGIIISVPFGLGLMALRYRIVVGATTIDVIGFKRRCYALAEAERIAVERTAKGGRVAIIFFKDGTSFTVSDTVAEFRDFLNLLSERTSLPIAKPVWDPNILH
ncbi:hypothetical protein [Dyella caseinilytica]|uniref:PH domain-containing protein n=1 Tax=Dyella caseinilytica TaxID=1849581 RepID=A0ABX7GWB8_9GAMM|nr:hypothetical protein [Dyella caseinilytica]QRN54754.1 hypothetical protein ISN74_05205 [Dyella caseinilytica]GFZ96620.1 hypothetical protein GCM10011408_16270 [Dyella caseinilytica]